MCSPCSSRQAHSSHSSSSISGANSSSTNRRSAPPHEEDAVTAAISSIYKNGDWRSRAIYDYCHGTAPCRRISSRDTKSGSSSPSCERTLHTIERLRSSSERYKTRSWRASSSPRHETSHSRAPLSPQPSTSHTTKYSLYTSPKKSTKRGQSSKGGPAQKVPRLLGHRELITFFSAHQKTNNKPLDTLCSLIQNAKKNIFFKIYHLSSPQILQALIEAADRVSVVVRYQQGDRVRDICAGSAVKLNKRNSHSLLHKKSAFFDYKKLFLSTGNFTDRSLTKDYNLAMLIHNAPLCAQVASSTPTTTVVGNQTITYCPISQNSAGKPLKQILFSIANAKSTIRIAMFILSHQNILKAAATAAKRGVDVQIIIDPREKRNTFKIVEENNLQLAIRECARGGILHTKICCVDNNTLITGSPNWTKCGLSRNLEDLFVIRNLTEPQLQSLQELWQAIQESSEPLTKESSELPPRSLKQIKEEEKLMCDPEEGTSSTR
ncbi:phospholipase D-like domain-containing protein [Chlamydia suis]|uniref:phospholipase D n=1 Tax=Chlamydia suis TaxID=83559 RepID=A0AAQ0ELT0_9CHLA|nr:phospholipase D-like domain-containing protein [Chlamydia suis]MEB2680965.1 phospholipase D-like domain-containing protein [Chlamydia suis]MEB2682165.1 phospholipase D-like domain-containing protein [Chlamydia suis]MEB2683088.1 phospholipase D-like domain-containing protein [Chlamydia suis]MEB2683673.1 phospholipase D-like domain-containing protein [Chlamydia suis]MEB2684903.1 phospholipase D-like domain-containing protein [Chlamydia suis]